MWRTNPVQVEESILVELEVCLDSFGMSLGVFTEGSGHALDTDGGNIEVSEHPTNTRRKDRQ